MSADLNTLVTAVQTKDDEFQAAAAKAIAAERAVAAAAATQAERREDTKQRMGAHQSATQRLAALDGGRAKLKDELKTVTAQHATKQKELDAKQAGDVDSAVKWKQVKALIDEVGRLAAAKARLQGQGEQLELERKAAADAAETAKKAADAATAAETAAEKAVEEAEEAHKAAEIVRDEASKARDKARQELTAVLPPAPQVPDPEVIRIISGRPTTKPRDFLSIVERGNGFAPLVRQALDALGKDLKQQHDALRNQLVHDGIASDIEKVTQRLNRQRLSDIRRAVLARVYPKLLKKRLMNGGAQFDLKRAKDTSGLSTAILADLEADAGSLDDFAKLLATRTAEAMALEAPPGSAKYQLLVARLRGGM
jgi:hypothetical protein